MQLLSLSRSNARDKTTANAIRLSPLRGLEGVVAKKLASRYQSNERGWVKLKNPNYWRRDAEMEAMQKSRERPRAVKPAA